MNTRDPLLFDLGAPAGFGEAVARTAEAELGDIEERRFEDSEHKTRPLTAVRGRDVYVLQSMHSDAQASVNDKLMRLLLFAATVRDAGAARVTALVPYLAYARKDRRTQPDDPVSTRYVAQLMEAVGTDIVVTMDAHNVAAYQNAFRCRTEHLEARDLFVGHVLADVGSADVVVVSPDAGGMKRADAFAQALGSARGNPVAVAFAEKYRSGGVVRGEALVGDVRGKVAVVIDDLISAGTTMTRAADNCLAHGASRVVAAATHAVFAPAAAATLGASRIDALVVTDTVTPVPAVEVRMQGRIVRLSAAVPFGHAVHALHDEFARLR